MEIIVRYKENRQIELFEDISYKLETLWDELSQNKSFIDKYNLIKKDLMAKKQLNKSKRQILAINDPQKFAEEKRNKNLRLRNKRQKKAKLSNYAQR